MTGYLSQLRLFNRNTYLFFVTIFLFGFTFDGGIYSVVFNLYLLRLGYGPEFIGQVNSTGLLAFTLFSLPSGLLGSRWGSRRLMTAGIVVMIISSSALPFAEYSPGLGQAEWLFLTYGFFLLGAAMYFVNAPPLLMKLASADIRSQAFSIQVALWLFAAFVGSLVGGLLPGFFAGLLSTSLDEPTAYRYALFVAAIALLPAFFAIRAIGESGSSLSQPSVRGSLTGNSARDNLAKAAAIPLMLLIILMAVRLFQIVGMAAIFTFLNVYLDRALAVSTALIGTLSGLGRLLAIPASLATPFLVRRYGTERVIIWAIYGGALSMLPLVFVSHWMAAGVSLAGVMALSSVRYPVFLIFSMEIVSEEQRGLVSGINEMAAGLGFSAVALSGGYIITSLGYQALFLITGLLTAFSAVIFWIYFRKPRGGRRQPELELETAAV